MEKFCRLVFLVHCNGSSLFSRIVQPLLQAHENSRDGPSVYVVTELCGDGDLFQLLRNAPDGRLSGHEAARVMLQVTSGVLFLHSKLGLAHRDLSLENVFLRHGVCKVGDFGAAVSLRTTRCDRVGKWQYMAPEVVGCGSEGYDAASADVWSLGVMLFVLVSGSPLVGERGAASDKRYAVVRRRGVGAILRAWGVEISSELLSAREYASRGAHQAPKCRGTLAAHQSNE